MSKALVGIGALAGLAGGAYFLAPSIFGLGSIGGGIATTGALDAALASGTGLGTIGASSLAATATLPAWLSPALTIAGGGFSAYNQIQQGNALKAAGKADEAAANVEAGLMERNAGEVRANAQRAALDQKRQVGLIKSRAEAVGGASGAGGPGLVNTIADLDAEGEYRYLTALANGENEAQNLEYGAKVRRAGGIDSRAAGNMQGNSAYMRSVGTLAQTGLNATLLAKYG